MNGFLADSPVLCSLLDRQSGRDRPAAAAGDKAVGDGADADGDGTGAEGGGKEGKKGGKGEDAMDGMAYDMMMVSFRNFERP